MEIAGILTSASEAVWVGEGRNPERGGHIGRISRPSAPWDTLRSRWETPRPPEPSGDDRHHHRARERKEGAIAFGAGFAGLADGSFRAMLGRRTWPDGKLQFLPTSTKNGFRFAPVRVFGRILAHTELLGLTDDYQAA